MPRTAFVHLFEWQWTDIASECENHLGPDGYSAVQVSPPQKSISGSQWWTRYQPVSYSIEGRSGTRSQFIDMINRCKAVGVGIYVDAVVNHMAASNRNFPEVPYGSNDFHSCTTDINYSNLWQVQNCDLSGLNDLKTESDYVRGKIAVYLNDLTSMGVAGFRIDAAKHMPPADVSNIIGRLVGNPYIYQEVIGAANEPVQPSQYTYISDVTEFNFSNTLGSYFKGRAPIKDLKNIGSWGGWLASADAQVFVANHDNQRQNTSNIITHKDGGNLNVLAHIFMLGWPYGYPEVMSSYEWSHHDQGPPSSGASACNNGWLCEHRIRAIKNMVAFRNNTSATFSATNQWDNGSNQMAWGRGGLGFVALSRDGDVTRTFQTGMPAGTYCDIIHADFDYNAGTCSGATVTVDGSGNANFKVSNRDAVAFHVGAKVGVPCPSCGGGSSGDTGSSSSSSSISSSTSSSVSTDTWYFRGTPNNWATTPMTFQDGLYCTEQQFGASSTSPRFKIDHRADWTESYPAADYVVNANSKYQICFNASSHAITATVLTTASSSVIALSSSSKSSSSAVVTSSSSSRSSVKSATSSSAAPSQSGYFVLESNQYVIHENVGSFAINVSRLGGADGASSVVVSLQNSITAINSFSETVYFANGVTQQIINVNIIDNSVYQGNETADIILTNPVGSTLGDAKSTKIYLIDDEVPAVDQPGKLQLTEAVYIVNENANELPVTITRSEGSSGEVSAMLKTKNGTAIDGTDYLATETTVVLADGEQSKTVYISILDNQTYSGERKLTLELSNVTGGAILGGLSSSAVTIKDDDAAPVAGVLQFNAESYSANESDKIVILTVSRTNGSVGSASVDYNITNGTAILGQDFIATNGTLYFADNEASKTISFVVVDDSLVEGLERFSVTLSNATQASLGNPVTVQITIADNDATTGGSETNNGGSKGGGAISPWLLLIGLLCLPWARIRAGSLQLAARKP